MAAPRGAEAWRDGYRLLAERAATIPRALRETAALALPVLELPRSVRRFVVTGVGSSAAHARFLVHLLSEHLGLDARALPLGSFLRPPARASESDVLVVFSQGLSPNAHLPLRYASAWRRVLVVTAHGSRSALDSRSIEPAVEASAATALAPERAARIAELLARLPSTCRIVRFAGEDEYGTLLRIVGPMCGYLAALRLAGRVAAAIVNTAADLAVDLDTICAAVRRAPERVDREPIGQQIVTLAEPQTVAFVTFGRYGDIVANLAFKVLEGMLLPLPPVWDIMHFAHGPFQQIAGRRASLLALTCGDPLDPVERELLSRLESMLDPTRHQLIRLHASLPSPLAIFEHEALMNELVLRVIAARGIDQLRWPGRGADAPLYDLAHDLAPGETGEAGRGRST